MKNPTLFGLTIFASLVLMVVAGAALATEATPAKQTAAIVGNTGTGGSPLKMPTEALLAEEGGAVTMEPANTTNHRGGNPPLKFPSATFTGKNFAS